MTRGRVSRSVRVYLEAPSRKRQAEFLERVQASRKLHGSWLRAPSAPEQFRDLLVRARSERQGSFFVCTSESSELAGVINLNEIVRGLFQSAYLSYYALEPFSGAGYLSEGLALVLDQAFGDARADFGRRARDCSRSSSPGYRPCPSGDQCHQLYLLYYALRPLRVTRTRLPGVARRVLSSYKLVAVDAARKAIGVAESRRNRVRVSERAHAVRAGRPREGDR